MNRGAENAPEPQPASASAIQNGVSAYQPDESALRGASLEVVPSDHAPQPEPTGQLHTARMHIRDFYCCQTRMERLNKSCILGLSISILFSDYCQRQNEVGLILQQQVFMSGMRWVWNMLPRLTEYICDPCRWAAGAGQDIAPGDRGSACA